MSRMIASALTLVAMLAAGPALVHGQQRDEPPVCLRFAFGQWTPALDWRAAGHETPIDSSVHQRAEEGRDWATTQAVDDEHTLMLLPSWWPAGVSVTLPDRAPAQGDTVVGSAFAFIADGRKKAPTATVRAWRVPCSARAR